jgi:hypothetical protein
MTVVPGSFPNQKSVPDPSKPPIKCIKCAPLAADIMRPKKTTKIYLSRYNACTHPKIMVSLLSLYSHFDI